MKSNFPGIRPSIARWVAEGVFCSGAAWKDTQQCARSMRVLESYANSPGQHTRQRLEGGQGGGCGAKDLAQPESSPATTTKLMLIAAVVMVVCTLVYKFMGPA